MPENDTKHTVCVTKPFLQIKKVKTIDWPCISPDLNPFEHLWSILKWKMEETTPSNKEQLKQINFDEWKKITLDVCSELVLFMPRRIKAVMENKR